MLRILLFGHMNLATANGSNDISAVAAAQGLLAYLLLHRREPLPRKHVAFTLWPDSREDEALAHLRRHLYLVQHLLPPTTPDRPWILADRVTVRWNPTCDYWLDVEEFESLCAESHAEPGERASMPDIAGLERAISLYVGDLLPDCYDDWLLVERERLWRIYSEALARLTGLRAAAGDLRGALAAAERLASHDSMREDAHRLVMALHFLAGDRAAALAAFDECRRVLAAELDLDPMPDTVRLADAIREARAPEQILDLVRRDFAMDIKAAVLAARALPHNLRCPLTRFIGRERALATVTELLRAHRLLTLTGAAGCGKTRLALEVAAGLAGAGERANEATRVAAPTQGQPPFSDGLWWVDVAPIRDPTLLPRAVADVLGVAEEPGRPPLEAIEEAVRTKSLLLLLDNAEHLADACAGVAERLLGAGAAVHVLATSRQPLGVVGEATWLVPPLTVPTEASDRAVDEVMRHEAPRLFVDRAGLCDATFTVAEAEAPLVASLSRRLDGIPLAVELAAAQVRALSLRQINQQLDDRFRLLVGSERAPTPHHVTLQTAIDWSHEQLTEPERVLFRRLAVFRDGWALEAAEAVCGGEGLATAYCSVVLASLVARSLVAVGDGGGGRRYRMLETIRQYAGDRMTETGEAAAVRSRHLHYFLTLAEEAAPQLRSGDQTKWLNRLEQDRHNLLAALDAETTDPVTAEAQLRLAAHLMWFWIIRGHIREGLDRLSAALTKHRVADLTRQKALQAAAALADMLGDSATARALSEENLTSSASTGNLVGVASSLGLLGSLDIREGHFEAAHRHFEQSVRILRDLGNDEGIASVLHNLAILEAETGDFAAARQHAEESLAISRSRADTKGTVPTLQILGEMAVHTGDYQRAKAHFTECLDVARQVGFDYAVAVALSDLGHLAQADGDEKAARRLLDESLALHRESGDLEGVAVALTRLAAVELAAGNSQAARGLCQESVQLAWQLGDVRQVVRSLEALADVEIATGQCQRGAVLYGAVMVQREAIGAVPGADRRIEQGRMADAARDVPSGAEWDAAMTRGRAMSLDEAVTLALGDAHPDSP